MKAIIQSTKTWYHVKLSNAGSPDSSEPEFDANVNTILASFTENPKDVILNLTEIGFLPTTCIRHFARLVQGVRGRQCSVAFLNLPESIQSILSSGERTRSPKKFLSEKEAVKFVTQKMKEKKEPEKQFLVFQHS